MKTLFLTFVGAILAGLSIGIAGTVFLRVSEPMVGSWLFGFGLLSIVVLGFKLFTGAIGYLAAPGTTTLRYARDCAVIWLGNLVGTGLVGLAMRSSRVFPSFDVRIAKMVAEKLNDGPLSIFILAVFCGLLMYIAVDTWKKELPAAVRLATLFLCVVVFILSGFEHCIANMYYFAVSAAYGSAHTWAWLAIMTTGNAVGGMLLPALGRCGR